MRWVLILALLAPNVALANDAADAFFSDCMSGQAVKDRARDMLANQGVTCPTPHDCAERTPEEEASYLAAMTVFVPLQCYAEALQICMISQDRDACALTLATAANEVSGRIVTDFPQPRIDALVAQLSTQDAKRVQDEYTQLTQPRQFDCDELFRSSAFGLPDVAQHFESETVCALYGAFRPLFVRHRAAVFIQGNEERTGE